MTRFVVQFRMVPPCRQGAKKRLCPNPPSRRKGEVGSSDVKHGGAETAALRCR